LDSRIISDFPKNVAAFRKFSLLWRGSRDGFQKEEFHRRCDGHANTLTVILDTNGNIFGGFTPVKWASPKKSKVQGGSQSEEFCFHAEESAQHPDEEICVEGRNEARGNRL
jgi:hypothetical protein